LFIVDLRGRIITFDTVSVQKTVALRLSPNGQYIVGFRLGMIDAARYSSGQTMRRRGTDLEHIKHGIVHLACAGRRGKYQIAVKRRMGWHRGPPYAVLRRNGNALGLCFAKVGVGRNDGDCCVAARIKRCIL
jgi:hypothetical protein